jgi:hypothetical protein
MSKAVQTTALFPLGQVLLTPGAIEALNEAGQLPHEFLSRHLSGDWGDLCDEDKRENEFSINRALRILSKYHTSKGEALYVITEADRSATTILRPAEY